MRRILFSLSALLMATPLTSAVTADNVFSCLQDPISVEEGRILGEFPEAYLAADLTGIPATMFKGGINRQREDIPELMGDHSRVYIHDQLPTALVVTVQGCGTARYEVPRQMALWALGAPISEKFIADRSAAR